MVAQTKEIYEEMKRLQEATGKFQLNVGNYTEASERNYCVWRQIKRNVRFK